MFMLQSNKPINFFFSFHFLSDFPLYQILQMIKQGLHKTVFSMLKNWGKIWKFSFQHLLLFAYIWQLYMFQQQFTNILRVLNWTNDTYTLLNHWTVESINRTKLHSIRISHTKNMWQMPTILNLCTIKLPPRKTHFTNQKQKPILNERSHFVSMIIIILVWCCCRVRKKKYIFNNNKLPILLVHHIKRLFNAWREIARSLLLYL